MGPDSSCIWASHLAVAPAMWLVSDSPEAVVILSLAALAAALAALVRGYGCTPGGRCAILHASFLAPLLLMLRHQPETIQVVAVCFAILFGFKVVSCPKVPSDK